MSKVSLSFMFLCLAVSYSCESSTDPEEDIPPTNISTILWTDPVSLSPVFELSNGYGQPSISGDGKTMYLSGRAPGSIGHGIYYSTLADTGWTTPILTNLSYYYIQNVSNPCISYDGNTLFFTKSSNLLRSQKTTNSNWSPPDTLFIGGSPTITRDGLTLYYSKNESFANSYINYAELVGGNWVERGKIESIGSGYYDPSVSGDGNILIFRKLVNSQQRFYYSERKNDAWSSPIQLGDNIHIARNISAPCISWDKETLYFSFAFGIGIYYSERL